MATKIRLKRQGKKFYAFYRVVVVDSRKKRDGKVIEEIGTYNPNTQPSTIQIKSDRAQPEREDGVLLHGQLWIL